MNCGTRSSGLFIDIFKFARFSSRYNPWPRPGIAVLFIESLGVVSIRTMLNRTLCRTRAGLNCEPFNREPEQLVFKLHVGFKTVWNGKSSLFPDGFTHTFIQVMFDHFLDHLIKRNFTLPSQFFLRF
jgi:hypothetical protein